MSSLLFGNQSIPVIPKLACAVGLNEAIILQQIYFWTEHNRKHNRNFMDGQYWVFNSYPQWQEQFPWWSVRTIQRTLTDMEKRGLIISGRYNKNKRDRTKWYRINYERLNGLLASGQSGILQHDDLELALPKNNQQRFRIEKEKTEKGRVSKSPPSPPAFQKEVNLAVGGVYKKDNIFDSVTKKYGCDRASYMLSVVDWYIDTAYPFYTGSCHPKENKAKRMAFAEKLLACSDSTVEEDQIVVDAIYRAIKEYVDCDPTIYYVTAPKVLGYWLIKDDSVGYECVYDTEYAPVENMY